MSSVETLPELFVELLKDIYYAEKKILKSLPKMAKAATSPKLIKAFETHRSETESQIERLEKVFKEIGEKPAGKKCAAIEGLSKEAEDVMNEVKDDAVMDAGLLADAQAVEHYEIARYGALVAWANALGYKQSAKLLQQTLDEEKKTDILLNKLAIAEINARAAGKSSANQDNEEEGEEEQSSSSSKRRRSA